jgi:hypothetical protein
LITNSTGASNLLVSGNNTSRVFNVNNGANLTINGLTVTNGNGVGVPSANGVGGGGIRNLGTLLLTNSTVTGNEAQGGGGGIFNEGALTLINATVSNNRLISSSQFYNGGGILSINNFTITNSIISGNMTANIAGGGIRNLSGSGTITNSTINSNSAGEPAKAEGLIITAAAH